MPAAMHAGCIAWGVGIGGSPDVAGSGVNPGQQSMDEAERRREQGSRRALLLPVYVPTALLSLCEGLLLPTLPLFALQFEGISFAVASLVLAASAIGTLVADVPAGMLLGRLGLKPTMILGATMVTLSTFMLAFAGSVPELVGYRLVAGVGAAMWAISRHAFITESIPIAQRGRAISVFGGINRIGVFGGPAIGGLIGSTLGLQESFVVAGVLGVFALVISWRYVRDTRVVAHSAHGVRWGLVRDMVRANWRDLSSASIAQTFAQMIRAGRQTIIPFYGATVLGLSSADVGIIQSASSSVDMLLFIPAGILMDRFGRKVAAVPSFAIMAVGMAAIPFSHSFWALLGASLVLGLGNGIGSGTMMTLGADLAPPGATGEFLGVWRLIGDTGRAGGPLAVGGLTDGVGFGPTAYILALFGLASSAILAVMVRETRIAPTADSPPTGGAP